MNNSRINPVNPDDPKWTAYVLGELDESERVEIERLLETSDEARALVEELSLAAITLKDELSPMTSYMMSPEQRAVIESAMQPAPKRWFETFTSTWGWGLAATVAAGLLLVLSLPMMKPETSFVPPGGATIAKSSAVVTDKSDVKANEAAQAAPASSPNSRTGGVAVSPVLSEKEVAPLLQGAVTTGSTMSGLSGAVVDPSNARMPGVTITARNQDNGIVTTQVTNESGVYDFPSLAPGTYQVAASLPGFTTSTINNLEVRSAENLRQDFPMKVGTIVSGVEVTTEVKGEASASVGQVVSQSTNRDLPLVGNNVVELMKVLPGVGAAPPPPASFAPVTPVAGAVRGGAGGGGGGRGGGRGAAAGGIMPGADVAVRAATPPPPPPSAAPARALDRIYNAGPNTEAYDRIIDNPFIRATQENFATFSIDVDTASYANMRRFLTQNQMPPRDAVRIEEMINYFSYDYAQPTGRDPIAPNLEVAAAPWNPQNRLVRIGIKARDIDVNRRPPSNLVFLIYVSGSMNTPEKLPLVKQGLHMLVDRLGENDTISIVVYAGASGLVLPPTSAIQKERIQQAIESLQPGGGTNGAAGIQLAYAQATANFIKGGTNRVILMTDGDFNVGVTNQGDLTRLIQDRAKSGVFLSVLGYGMGNLKDSTMEKLADQGNGHYAYIDSLREARKVLVEEMGSTLVTVAKDVKIQVDFNPARVEAYRLIGYENRVLRTEDFNNDAKDAGDMGAGHTVTALFEVVPKGGSVPGPSIEPSKYTERPAATAAAARGNGASSNEMLTLRVRYKQPDSDTSTKLDFPLVDQNRPFARATTDFRWAAAVAEFGMILRESPYRGNSSMEAVLDLAEGSRGGDRNGYRQEFIDLVQKARRLR